MFKKGFILLLSLFTCLEAGTLRLYDEAAETQSAMLHMKKGMTKEDVLYIMGYPYQAQNEKAGGRCYEVWYYFYKKPSLSQRRILRRNLIPLIFYKNHLHGWGESDYKRLFETEKEQMRRTRLKEIEYSNDRDEWPAKDHGYVPSPREELQKKNARTPPTQGESQERNTRLVPTPEQQKKIDSEVNKQKQTSPRGATGTSGYDNPIIPFGSSSSQPESQSSTPEVQIESDTELVIPTESSSPDENRVFEQSGSDVYEDNPYQGYEAPDEPTPVLEPVAPIAPVQPPEPDQEEEEAGGAENIFIHTEYPREYQQGEKKYQERLDQHEPLD